MINKKLKNELLNLYKRDIEIRNESHYIKEHNPLIKAYKTVEGLNSYINEINNIVTLLNPTILNLIPNDTNSYHTLYDLFARGDYLSAIVQCPWDDTLSSLILSVYIPECYFYSLSDKDTIIILRRLKLISCVGFNKLFKQTIIKDVYLFLSTTKKISPFLFCQLLLEM